MIAHHKGEIPFVILLLPFLAGIGLGIFCPLFISLTTLYYTFYTAALAFLCLNLSYKNLRLYRFKWLGGTLMHLILLVLGWVLTLNHNELSSKRHFSKQNADYLVVQISNEPKFKNGLVRFTASVQYTVSTHKKTATSGNLLISIKDTTAKSLFYGDILMVPASYQTIDPPYNPGEFNYKRYLTNQNIHYQEFLYAHQYYSLSRGNGNPIVTYALKLRQQLVEKFNRHLHNPEAVAVASTLILGYKADLSNDVLQAYSKTGTIHVLSVSGAHVAIVFLLLNYALSFLGRFKYGKTLKAVLIIAIIWYYALLTGFSPAVCRAAVMISMIITGRTYSRYINTLNILAVSAFLLLLYNPYFITDVGFQLSYLAVGGLVVLQPLVYKLVDIENKWADKLWLLCSISIAAQVITFPLSAFYFHQFPVYFLVSNLFIVIPSSIIMYAGLGYLLLPDIPYLSPALGWILEKTILWTDTALTAIEHFPYSGINKIWITSSEYLLLYIIIISIFYFIYKPRTWLLQFCICFMLILACCVSLKRWDNLRSDHIVFLNLRKHTGIIFKTGDKAFVMTDLSDTDKTYRYSVQPCLDTFQINKTYSLLPDTNIRLPYFSKKSNLMMFENKTLLIFDQSLQSAALPGKLHVDYLYLTHNPNTDLNFINRHYEYGLLIIANDNSDQLITKLKKQAIGQHKNYYLLQRNKSLLVSSN